MTIDDLVEMLEEKIREDGVSLRQASKDIGINVYTLSRILHRKENPGLKVYNKLIDYLEIYSINNTNSISKRVEHIELLSSQLIKEIEELKILLSKIEA